MGNSNLESKPVSTFAFTRRAKVRFYWHYVTNKLFRIWWEVETPKFQMFAYEIAYSMAMATRRPLPTKRFTNISHVRNFRGQYNVRPRTRDIAIASPAFERDDVDELLRGIRDLINRFESVVFLDIGADIGTYCITVGNAIDESGLRIVAYEPTSNSYQLLRSNVELNKLEIRIALRDTALGNSQDSECEMAIYVDETGNNSMHYPATRPHETERVKLTTLDAESTFIECQSKGQAIVVKIDCEGAEKDILAGGLRLLETSPEVLLLVEDFVDPSIVSFLFDGGWEFEKKLTPYNSFWRKTRFDVQQ
jgi:FkbM family methyltransferase